MILLVPSRGRPRRAAAMARSAHDTATDPVRVLLVVDPDDPFLDAYGRVEGVEVIVLPERLGYAGSLNAIGQTVWDGDDVLGAFGDDVLFRTPGWDRTVNEVLATPGFVYPNDKAHKEAFATAVFVSPVIPRALGWLAYPGCWHQYVDNVWMELGRATGALTYLPQVIVEHLHAAYGKAPWDDTYRGVYDEAQATADFNAFERWKVEGLERDAATVRAVL